MAEQWFYSKGGQRLGPVSGDELRAMASDGRLAPTDLIWCEGKTPDWVPASSAKGFFAEQTGPPPIPQSPPPLQSPPEPPPVASSSRFREGPSRHGRARSAGTRRSRPRSRARPGQEGEPWSGGHMALLVIGAIFVPLVGIIAGIIGLTKKPKKTQGGILLAIGVVNLLLTIGSASTQSGWYSGGSGAGIRSYQTRPALPPGVDDPEVWAKVVRSLPSASHAERMTWYQNLKKMKEAREIRRLQREAFGF